jgi:hypothetical protein
VATIVGVFLKSSLVNMNTFKDGNIREHGVSCGLLNDIASQNIENKTSETSAVLMVGNETLFHRFVSKEVILWCWW